MDLPEKAKRAPPAPVWNQSFLSPKALFVRGTFFIRCYPLVHSRGRSPIRNLIRGKIRTVLCYIVYHSCVQWYAHTTTYLEYLEMSGNLTAVGEMSGILLKIREMSGKEFCQGKLRDLRSFEIWLNSNRTSRIVITNAFDKCGKTQTPSENALLMFTLAVLCFNFHCFIDCCNARLVQLVVDLALNIIEHWTSLRWRIVCWVGC